MDTNYISLLNLAYEIEGLLLLHINRGEEASPEMTELLKKKIAQMAAAYPAETGKPGGPAAEPRPANPTEPVNDGEEYNDDFAEEEKGTEESLPSAEECRAVMKEEATAEDNAVAESVTFEETEDAEPEKAESAGTEKAADAEPDEPVRLEDKLSRERAKDIYKAFTINDKFRFRRELFRNSQDEFDETLDVIAQMNTFDEAEDYFYNDLCWDADNEDVKEFMETVKKHF